MDKKMKVVLAYSGGLDTTVIIPWLKENYNCDVIAACIDVGQGKETDGLEERDVYKRQPTMSIGFKKVFLALPIDPMVQ